MTDRWEEINRIYDAALELAEEARPGFLENNCRGNEELRREVESLLAYDKQAQQFIDRPALQLAAEKLSNEPPSLIGRKLGPYQIQVALGAGGMGEVYKARDTRLNRTVAIKVLPRLLSERADLRQRFEREARAIAGLNHSNICALYDIGRQDGIDFLVMEYLEGETLSKRLKKGPLPAVQLLRTAIEIATALDQAHRHGVIHRDLKPGNIMLTKTGAKLLDFGLAKHQVLSPAAKSPSYLSPLARGTTGGHDTGEPGAGTETKSLTEEGMILGTLEYMAPEQVEGKEMDVRTDIFAFGVVMYEMATGRKAFEGESKASLTAAILTHEPPPITRIQPLTPPALERVVQRCLAKDPDERWQTTRDLTSELKWIAEAGRTGTGLEAAGLKPIATGGRRERLYGALAIAFFLAAIVSAFSYVRLVRAPTSTVISEILLPEKIHLGGAPVLSPDGTAVAFFAADENGKSLLWVRSFHSAVARPLAGTDQGASPFWSTNGKTLGFFADGKVKAFELPDGPARVVADAPAEGGGTWNREGTLLFVPDNSEGLYQAPSGGTAVPVLKLDRSKYSYFAYPKFLPDGKHFLYHAWALDPALSGTYFASLDGKENRLLPKGGGRATYGSGYLLYLRDRTLIAQAFDPKQGQLKGDGQAIAERVVASLQGDFFDVSENGVLIYLAGDSLKATRLSWFDRSGKELEVISEGESYQEVRVSPDGTKVALKAGDPNADIWVNVLARGVPMRLTNDPGYYTSATWSPDGSRILFGGHGGKSQHGIYQMNSNGAGGMGMLLAKRPSDPGLFPTSWSRDGRFVLFVSGAPGNPIQEVWVLPLVGDRKPRLLVQNAFDGQFSLDGRWVSYTSIESGKLQIYVVPFDATEVLNTAPGSVASHGDKYQISTNGFIARWGGKDVFYLGPDNQMMAAEVDVRGNRFQARKERALFRRPQGSGWYDVTQDGKRIVMITQKLSNTPLTLVVNWPGRLAKP
jgi:eukaryotic-like serine/threonine-protein kinase